MFAEMTFVFYRAFLRNIQNETQKNLLYGIIQQIHETSQITLPVTVRMSPLCTPDTMNMTPDTQKPDKARNSSFQSLAYFKYFELIDSFSLLKEFSLELIFLISDV
jgi:hypothetical protein